MSPSLGDAGCAWPMSPFFRFCGTGVPQEKVEGAIVVIWPGPCARAGKKCGGGAETLGPHCLPQSPGVTLGQLWSGAGLTENHLFFMAGFCEVVWCLIGCVFPGRCHWVLNLGRTIEPAAAVVLWTR